MVKIKESSSVKEKRLYIQKLLVDREKLVKTLRQLDDFHLEEMKHMYLRAQEIVVDINEPESVYLNILEYLGLFEEEERKRCDVYFPMFETWEILQLLWFADQGMIDQHFLLLNSKSFDWGDDFKKHLVVPSVFRGSQIKGESIGYRRRYLTSESAFNVVRSVMRIGQSFRNDLRFEEFVKMTNKLESFLHQIFEGGQKKLLGLLDLKLTVPLTLQVGNVLLQTIGKLDEISKLISVFFRHVGIISL